jgi:TonB family protein
MQSLIITQTQPIYPPIARAKHVQGVVVLHAIISKTGAVEKLAVLSGSPMLVQSAMDAVQKWTYRPFLLNGQPVEVETTINVNYTFGGPDLSCTYYDKGLQHAGTCEEDSANKGQYSCRADDDKGLVQSQSSCEWKVKRLQESQQGSLAPAQIRLPALQPAAFIVPNGSSDNQSRPVSSTTDQAENTPRKIGGNVSAPQVIHQVEPEFSDQAKMRAKTEGKDSKFEGQVLVQLIVNANGQPENVHFVHGVGMGLDEKAVEAVRQYRFRPAMENGNPVPVLLNVQVNFKLF